MTTSEQNQPQPGPWASRDGDGGMTAQQQDHGWQQPTEPLKPTTARWKNRRRRVKDSRGEWGEKWAKVLAHTGPYTQFRYGTDTPSDWQGRVQRCIICYPGSGTIGDDVDDEQKYLGTRTGKLIGRAQAISTRGGGYHILIDARAVPPGEWPSQGPIAGADIKSHGFIPLPGCDHYSGERYEPVPGAVIVTATPELIAAIRADREEHDRARRAAGNGSGQGGTGGGQDGEIAAAVLSMVLGGLDREQCYEQWLKIAVPLDPDWPYEQKDFERHHGGAVRKAAEIRAADEQTGQAALQAAAQWVQAAAGAVRPVSARRWAYVQARRRR